MHQLDFTRFDLLRSTFAFGGPELIDFDFISTIDIETCKQARCDHRTILRRKLQGFLQHTLS